MHKVCTLMHVVETFERMDALGLFVSACLKRSAQGRASGEEASGWNRSQSSGSRISLIRACVDSDFDIDIDCLPAAVGMGRIRTQPWTASGLF